MQRFFGEWAERDDGEVPAGGFTDLSEELYCRLNGELLDRLEPEQLRQRLARNLGLLEDVAGEIRSLAVADAAA
jgi:hypothetical protein